MTETMAYRSVGEWTLHSGRAYKEPFADVAVDVAFTAPSGRVVTMPAFYDGAGTWRVRFSPGEVGAWRYTVTARPGDPELDGAGGAFNVAGAETPGFIKATPDVGWGFTTEAGEPVFLMGDTTYNLFGAAHCGLDVEGFLRRRASQGFNLFRVRCQVSPYHPPEAYSDWQTRRTWPWGGSEQSPRFDRFNLDYFRTVDRVVRAAAELGVGFEMIMEAWGFEYPFNDRGVFVTEWEQLWLRYLAARYDAFRSVVVWTLMNEYEFYPDGDWRYNPLADRWAMRTARWLKSIAPHGHPVAVHNGPRVPPFAERFVADPGAIDAVMYQTWGATGPDDGWLAAGIEDEIRTSFAGWTSSGLFSEWGYERNPALPQTFPGFTHTDAEHNRRGAWRGAFCGLCVTNGFENTWGPVMNLDDDQEGVRYFEILHRFFTQVVPFHTLRPAPDLAAEEDYAPGHAPLVLATVNRDLVAVYLPAGGAVVLTLADQGYTAQVYDPRTGDVRAGALTATDAGLRVTAPSGGDAQRPCDWVVTLAAVEI